MLESIYNSYMLNFMCIWEYVCGYEIARPGGTDTYNMK